MARPRSTPRSWPVLFCLAAGCASSGQNFHDRQMDFSAIRSVAILPFTNLSGQQQAGERVRDVLTNMLLATQALYVLPSGEVARGLGRAGFGPQVPLGNEEIIKLGGILKVDAILTGVVKEYGEARSGGASANLISLSVQMTEVETGKVVWAASSTRGGVGFLDRLLGGGGDPMNKVTEAAVTDVVNKLFK